MKITICLGSSCHLKGSRLVVEELTRLVDERGLKERIELSGTFCLGKCQSGVNITVDDESFSVSPETVGSFFENEILPRLKTFPGGERI
ncbi:MAG: (2Fe-2S) ferredoxin domain-containing protein [Oscillospiraceae bacterium]